MNESQKGPSLDAQAKAEGKTEAIAEQGADTRGEAQRTSEFRRARRPREADLEKSFENDFQEYEEWRMAQMDESLPGEGQTKKPEPKKRQGFGRMDLIFIVLGFLVALLWRGCSAPK